MMKKLLISLIIGLLSVIMLPTTALAAYDYTVDKLDCTAELLKDGSAVITQEWTVTFRGKADGFTRQIVIPDDNFETFTSLDDVTVSVDGTVCGAADESKHDNTFSFAKKDDVYTVDWCTESEGETKVFALRYVLKGAVKLYDDKAYFYVGIVSSEENLVCRNVTVNVKTYGTCYAENFEILHSGSLAGKKTENNVQFIADNTAGEIKIGLSMPQTTFDAHLLPVILRDNTGVNIILCIVAVLLCVVVAYVIYYGFNRKTIIIKKWEKRCRKRVLDEASYKKQFAILKKIGAAEILGAVTQKTVSEADLFIVNLLELVKRGYIRVSPDGFDSSSVSDTDEIKRPLSKADRILLDEFGAEKWQTLIENKEAFYHIVRKHKKAVKLAPFFEFTLYGKKILDRCFEMSLSAGRHEFVSPARISDDFFANNKYTVIDLIISVINENRLSQNKDYKAEDTTKFSCDLFVLRENYAAGEEIFLLNKAKRKQEKNTKKQKTEPYDD